MKYNFRLRKLTLQHTHTNTDFLTHRPYVTQTNNNSIKMLRLEKYSIFVVKLKIKLIQT